jgi:hypothetical protein
VQVLMAAVPGIDETVALGALTTACGDLALALQTLEARYGTGSRSPTRSPSPRAEARPTRVEPSRRVAVPLHVLVGAQPPAESAWAADACVASPPVRQHRLM